MILELSMGFLERLGLIVIFAMLISRVVFFKKYVTGETRNWGVKILYGVFWGLLGVFMTVMGTQVSGGVANSRTIPVLLAGIIGGPFVGILSGIIAGIHRMLFYVGGDLTAFSCGVSTIIAGIIGGYSKKRLDGRPKRYYDGFLLGIIVEVIQMGVILILARPFDEAFELVKIIFLPMTVLNALGVGIFLYFIQQIYDESDNASAKMAHLSLQIANLTLQHLRKGLTETSAHAVTKIIFDLTHYDAVSITNTDCVLSHLGAGEDHHKPGSPIWTSKTKDALQTGSIKQALEKKEIGCDHTSCTLSSVIVVPLMINEQPIGTLKVYYTKPNAITKPDMELVKGLGNLFSTQLELGIIEKQKVLRAKAELTALRAQIKPHFLFNALNAIMSLTRTDPEKARTLLQELSIVLRSGFKDNEPFIPIEDELRFIDAYLNIEKARFPDKLKVEIYVEESLTFNLPPLILQPLIENAVKHGIQKKLGPGLITLEIKRVGEDLTFLIADDGVGMPDNLDEKSSGIGLSNVKERLMSIYNRELTIISRPNEGTQIRFSIPYQKLEES
ncbi:MAG TPA: LytS/YhcK type 5TM receptor domain-containing protein [Fusibacter sp.]|nr:LytS/YhcK type 5TM receptor domain-containing protein [Fusibacter sp.]